MSSDVAVEGARPAPPDPNIDCFDCAPDYEPLRGAISQDDWDAFAQTLALWPAHDVSRALFHLGEHDDASYQEFAELNRDHPLAKIALAYREVTLGWRARTSAPASGVRADQFVVFRRHLAAAEHLLVDACAIDPNIPSAWTARLLTARALSLSASELRRRYGRLTALGGDVWGQVHMHQYLEPKWFGSVEEAREFVDDELAASQEGSLSGVLVPLFHLERWYEPPGGADGSAYLASAEVQRELDAAAAHSVFHPEQTELTATVVWAHHVFLVAYWLSGEKAKAARHRRILGRRLAGEYWHMVSTTDARSQEVWRELAQIDAGAA